MKRAAAPSRPLHLASEQTVRSLEELREAEQRLRSLTELSSDYFWETDAQHRLVRTHHGRYYRPVNAAGDKFGRCRWEMPSTFPDAAGWAAHRERLERHEPFRDFEFARLDDEGAERWLAISGEPMFDAAGRFTGYRGVGKDVTERKRDEKLLNLEHRVARLLAEAGDRPAGLKVVLRAICETKGWECGRFFRRDADDVFRFGEAWHVPGEALERFIDYSHGKAFPRGVGVMGLAGAGETIWTPDIGRDPRMSSRAMVDDHGMRGALMFPALSEGAVVGVLSFTSREIREPDERLLKALGVIGSLVGQFLRRKEAEEVLRESEERFRMLTKASSDWYWEQDAEFRFVAMGEAIASKTGLAAASYIGKRRWEVPVGNMSEADWAAHRATCEAHLAFHDLELCRFTDDGEPKWVAISGEPIFGAAGAFKGYRGVAKDITARKRDERMMRLEHTVNRQLADADTELAGVLACARALCQSEGWECGRYFRVDEHAPALRFAGGWGVDDPDVERYIARSRGLAYAKGEGMTGLVWQTGEPLWRSERGSHHGLAQAVFGSTRDVFIFPLFAGGRVVGVLSFISRTLRAPDERLLRAVRVIGSQIGQFVQRKQAEEVLRESEERFRMLTKASSDWYWEQDAELRFVAMGKAIVDKTGISATGHIGKRRWDLAALNLSEADWAAHRAICEAHLPFHDFELCRLTEDGRPSWVLISGEPIFDAAGVFRGYRGVGKDITARKRAEQLRELEHTVTRELAAANSVSGVIGAAIRAVCESEGWDCGRYFAPAAKSGELRMAFAWGVADEAVQRYLAASRELAYRPGAGLAGRVWESGEPLWVEDTDRDPRVLQRALNSTSGMRGAFVFPVIADGKTIGVLTFSTRSKREPEDALLQAIRVIGIQIGQFVQRKQAEEEVRESEERFRNLSELSSDWFWEQDDELRFVTIGAALAKKTGISGSEQIGKRRWDVPAVNMSEADWAEHRAACEAHLPFRDLELCRLTGEGKLTWVVVSGEPIFDAAGVFRGYRGVGKDITARKRAEQLRELEHTVTRELAAASSVAGVIGAAIRAVCETEGWDCGRYFAPASKSGELRMAFAWGVADEAVQRFLAASRELAYRPGVGLAGRVWDCGEAMWVEDIWRDDRVAHSAPLARESGMRGAFVFPVIADGRTIGVLAFSSRAKRQPEEALLQAIRVIGIQIGQFVQRKQAEESVRESEERFRSLTKLSSDVYWEQDEALRFTSIAGAGSGPLSGALPPLGRKAWEHDYLNLSADDWLRHMERVQVHQPFRDMELCRADAQGSHVWISISGEPVFDAGGRFRGYRGVGKDITARKLDEERIQYLATHDALTSLPNRAMFGELLTLSTRNARRYGRTFAVLFVDLDRFKVINDTLGHEAGDKLLQQVAERLAGTVRASDVVARLGGDEFVVLLQEVSEPHQAETVARKILAALARPAYVAGQEIRVTASIGVCLYPSDAQDEQTLMKNADIAMYRAKEEGKNTCKFYSAKSNSLSFERLALETSLRRGLERGEFSLHYQAKVDLRSGAITGVEALLRWQHPELGMVPPGQFIPLAEETGLIVPLGKWVLRAACEQGVAWRRAGLPPVRMSVNISGRQFADEHLLADIAEALASSGLEPSRLELEITESMVMQNADRAATVLDAIKKMGVRLAIDDFGVGYSSLAQLKRLPIDTLKVDRSFIRDIPQDAGDSAIAEAIIAMGKRLQLTVVAEGVETSEQQAFLKAHDCDEMQGFFFSRPIPADAFAELLQRSSTAR